MENKIMKIVLVIPYNPLEEVGGLEIGTLFLANNLIQEGNEVIILTKGMSGKLGVPIVGFSSFANLCQYLVCKYEQIDVVQWMEIFPDQGEIDIQAMTSGVLRSLGIKVILMVATSGNLKNRGNGELTTRLIQNCFDDYVISNNDQIAEFFDSGIILSEQNAIGLGVDLQNIFIPADDQLKRRLRDELGLPQNKILCLFIGRFVERKRPDFLLKAWEKLSGLYNRAALVVVGSGMNQHDSIGSEIEEMAKSSKSSHFRDVTINPEKYYQACDIMLLPSSREGQPNVLLESMACANAIIGSDIAGINEMLINDINGLTFSVNDQDSFIKSICLLVDNEDLRLNYGQKARYSVLKKDWGIVTKQYIELYKK